MKYKHCLIAITTAFLLTACQLMQAPESELDRNTQVVNGTQPTMALTETEWLSSETQPPSQDTAPLSNIVHCDSIKLPYSIRYIDRIKRTADGFSGIAYTMDHQSAYVHISDDLQTVDSSVLIPPEDQDGYLLENQYFALEENEIWAFAIMESHGNLKPYDPETDDGSYDWEGWNAAKQERYLLCHYDENGSLLSAIPANEMQEYCNPLTGYFGNVKNFDCVGGILYMTIFDDRVLQIDKETAGVSIASDLRKEDISYDDTNLCNDYTLCFDRDDKPVLLRKKKRLHGPDVPSDINEAVLYEYDLASSSCGQKIYTTGDDWNETNYFSVLKGIGEYRLFVNTGMQLIGIRDDGTQELLIDIEDSNLFDMQDVPLTAQYACYMDIVPVDDTRFLGTHYKWSDNATEAFCLTRKHE